MARVFFVSFSNYTTSSFSHSLFSLYLPPTADQLLKTCTLEQIAATPSLIGSLEPFPPDDDDDLPPTSRPWTCSPSSSFARASRAPTSGLGGGSSPSVTTSTSAAAHSASSSLASAASSGASASVPPPKEHLRKANRSDAPAVVAGSSSSCLRSPGPPKA